MPAGRPVWGWEVALGVGGAGWEGGVWLESAALRYVVRAGRPVLLGVCAAGWEVGV